jgi:hypothetical protein
MKKLTILLLLSTLLAAGLATAFRIDGLRARRERDTAQKTQQRLEGELQAAEIRLAQAGRQAVEPDEVPARILKDRIAELEEKLSAREREMKALQDQAREAQAKDGEEEDQQAARGPADWRQQQRERMEQLQAEDPQEYARIQEERQTFQRKISENVGGQVEFLASLNLEGLTQEQLDNHSILMERLTTFRQKIDQLNSDPAAAEDGVSRRELFQEFREITPLLEAERQVVLNDLAIDLGYAPDETQSFVEYVDYVNEMTSPRAIMRGVWGGRGR